ncbi:DUF6221 family protein [Streptomyces iakyrus]|uniref:DUF6221 family protein n=1 Tax=Streptomyces iakyrus TaxID=68219 RepID=UPI00367E1760
MDDLVQFLRDRLDEDERAARRAGDSFRQIGETGVIVATEGDRAEECASANWAGIAEHIVRHDPARVLAEVAAKRQIIDRCVSAQIPIRDDWSTDELAGDVLAMLALPYADHPAYKPEWHP